MTENLRQEQDRTLASDRMRAGIPARVLFATMDRLYGREASLPKFRVLEVVARVPYFAWEHVGYVAITHTHQRPRLARDIHDEVKTVRAQQDNEFFHLLILEELLQRRDTPLSGFRDRVLPQVIAAVYYYVSWLLYVVRPRWSHELNAQFEDHAEHEYMRYVADHPELDEEPWVSEFRDDYGHHSTVGDLLRQIALDERHHKDASLARLDTARFGSAGGSAD